MYVAEVIESHHEDGLTFVDNKRRRIQERKEMGRPNIELDQPLLIQNGDQDILTEKEVLISAANVDQ